MSEILGTDKTRLKSFIDSNKWIFAKTYTKTAPHEYIVYEDLDDEVKKEYMWFIQQIKEKGVDEKFYQSTFRYLYFDGMKYWVHNSGDDPEGILNRDHSENKYH
jgi:hypothetical protein